MIPLVSLTDSVIISTGRNKHETNSKQSQTETPDRLREMMLKSNEAFISGSWGDKKE